MKNIIGLAVLIAMDNGMAMKPFEEIRLSEKDGYNWSELDAQAATLNPLEAEAFCCAEHYEMHQLVKRTGFYKLHDVMNEIFDGDLHDYFFNV